MNNWNLLEADFIREYRIDLVKELKGMSFRRFMVLIHGLSEFSRWRQAVPKDEEPERGKDVVITDPDIIAAKVAQYGL